MHLSNFSKKLSSLEPSFFPILKFRGARFLLYANFQLSRNNLGSYPRRQVLATLFFRLSESEIQNLPSGGHHGAAASKKYWVCYKPLILSYLGVGAYEPSKTMYLKLL